jgi:predicted AlkP superfamily phosphohydrolase/phosphomutase
MFGWGSGSLLYMEFGWATGFYNPPGDTILIYLFLSVTSAAIFALGGAAAGILARALPRSSGATGKQASIFFSAFAVAWIHLSLLCVEAKRPFAFDTIGLALLSLVLLLSFGIAWVAARSSRVSTTPIVSLPRASALFAFVQLAILAAGVTLSWSQSQPAPNRDIADVPIRPIESKVLLFAIDGATWNIMDRLIDEGRLPHIAKLASGGARGDLASIPSPLNPLANTSGRGMRTPVIWTTISSGKPDTEHGIFDFVFTKIPVLSSPIPMRVPLMSRIGQWENLFSVPRQPVNATAKRVTEIWDILEAVGRRVGILGWVITHPVTGISGVKVSNLFTFPIEDRWYPADLLPSDFTLADLPEGRLSELWRFVDRTSPSDAAGGMEALLADPVLGGPLTEFAEQYFQDSFLLELGDQLYGQQDFDFFTVYVDGTDVAGHLFWKHMEPEHFGDVDEREMALFHGLIEEYYEYIDEAIGSILEHRGEDTLVILCSDHGMGPWKDEDGPFAWMGSRTSYPFNSGNHRREGIVLLNGPGVRPGSKLHDATVLDIAPTVLHYMGYPVADDMPGEVLSSAFTEQWIAANDVVRIDSYEGRVQPPDRERSEIPTEVDDALEDRLRELGYIE